MTRPIWRYIPPVTEGFYFVEPEGMDLRVLNFYRNGGKMHAEPSYLFPKGKKYRCAGPLALPIDDPEHPAPPAELEADRE